MQITRIANHFKVSHTTLLLIIIFAAAAVRAPLVFDDFWLDEIWSLNLASSIDSLAGVFIDIKIDANHILNTAFLHVIGEANSWVIYRSLSFFCGLISILLVFKISLVFGEKVALTSAVMLAMCFPMVLYSTEARGYSMSIMFSLMAFLSLQRYLAQGRKLYIVLFWVAVILAMLSHFSFAYVYAAYLQWSLYAIFMTERTKLEKTRDFVYLHILPLFVFAYIYYYFILQMGVAGENVSTWHYEIAKFVSLLLGLPQSVELIFVFLILLVAAIVWVSYFLYKTQSIYGPFFLLVIIINPVIVILVADYGYPQMRYFLLLMPFLIISLAVCLVCLSKKIKLGASIFWVLVSVYVINSIIFTHSFSVKGRGEYLAAMRYIVDNSGGRIISISSDHDYRNYALVGFYSKYLPRTHLIKYVFQKGISENIPEWYIVHDFSRKPSASDELSLGEDANYELANSFLAANPDVIGWHWHLYKKL